MPRQAQVLVISRPECPDLQDLCECWYPTSYRTASCDEFRRDIVLQPCPELLILVGLPEPSPALELLRWLSGRRVSSRILAILPRSATDSDIAGASAGADQFILWPEPA